MVNRSEWGRIKRYYRNWVKPGSRQLGSRNVLTVSDSPGLAERGVAINFVVVEGKLKFEINTATLKRAGCRRARNCSNWP